MSSVIFYAFPSFYYKFVASSSHSPLREEGWTHIWGMCADPGGREGWESWAAPGGKKEAEQSAGVPVLQSFWQTVLKQSWERCHLTAAGNHASWQEGISPSHSSAMLCFFRAACQRATQHEVNSLSLLQAAQIHWHTLLLPSKGHGTGGGGHSNLLFPPTSEGL